MGAAIRSLPQPQRLLGALQTERGISVIQRKSAVQRSHELRRTVVFDRPQSGDDRSGAAPLHQCAQALDLAPIVASRATQAGLTGRERYQVDSLEVEGADGTEGELGAIAQHPAQNATVS